MKDLENNITFVILNQKDDWRDELTLRYCEHYSKTFNGAKFNDFILIAESVDEALEKCFTKYVVFQESGNVIAEKSFFGAALSYFKVHPNFLLCDFMLDDDYCIVRKNLFMIHRERWERAEKPAFSSKGNIGPLIKVLEKTNDARLPLSINLHQTESILISRHCANNGAAMIIADIQRSASIATMKKNVSETTHYYLRRDNPFHEIFHETYFEKNFYNRHNKRIRINDDDGYLNIPQISADSLVVPACGLKAVNLAQYTGAKHLVIYDVNPLALELQRRLFEVKSSQLFGDILAKFKKDYPHAEFDGDQRDNEFSVVTPVQVKSLKLIQLDIFSHECLDLVKFVDQHHSAVFDFSNHFVTPNNFFRKKLINVVHLFEAACSVIKSRRGPSFILGESPTSVNMNDLKINTRALEIDREQDVSEYEGWDKQLDAIHEEPKAKPKPEPQLPAGYQDLIDSAKKQGYDIDAAVEEIRGVKQVKLKLTKVVMFPDFNCIYEYRVASQDNKWSFKINKYGHEKKLELSNGNTVEGLKLHVETINKFNSKAVAKML